MKLALALALGGLAALVKGIELPFTTCGEDNLGVEKVEVSELPLKPGDSVSLSVSFLPKVTVDVGAQLTLALAIRGQKLFETTADMCGAALSCPLLAGQEVTAATTQTIPAGAPPIKLQVVVSGKDANGTALTCIQTTVEFASAARLGTDELEARPAITSALLAEVAMAPEGRTWAAHWSPRFANATLKQAVGMMGTVLRGHPLHMTLPEKPLAAFLTGPNDTIPASFDAREAWPQCREIIGHIRDQSACGSCWAVASTESFNDRWCIAHNLTATFFSPTDTMACCAGASCGFSQGCNGGQPAGAWSFFADSGIVTGGDFPDVGTGKTCLPYPFPGCAHHVEPTAEVPACPTEDYETPQCRVMCSEREYEQAYLMDKHKAKRGYSLRRDVEAIQREIMEEGPVTAAFTVYQDFLTYKEGIYQHAAGTPLGGHAVKIIGWGEDETAAFWLVQNQWGELWGEKGLFRIVRGTNECGIEDDITAGTV